MKINKLLFGTLCILTSIPFVAADLKPNPPVLKEVILNYAIAAVIVGALVWFSIGLVKFIIKKIKNKNVSEGTNKDIDKTLNKDSAIKK